MRYHYYFEDVGKGNQCWFVWDDGKKITETEISLHGARELGYLLKGLGFVNDETLRL